MLWPEYACYTSLGEEVYGGLGGAIAISVWVNPFIDLANLPTKPKKLFSCHQCVPL